MSNNSGIIPSTFS